ncbi:MAG: beta galactosidase jelly roll domain-containing protein [Phycisphaerales bacterium]|nr:beta galactosidase jelly roll domain-containing protein [Phycisphaerales bacterium]
MSNHSIACVAAALASVFAAGIGTADVTLPSIISDHMVLQCNARAKIWGWADPGDEIGIAPSWSGATPQRATAGADGAWSVQIDTPAAGGPHTLQISGPDNGITISDVLVGEVWICGGQSNMEWSVNAIGPDGTDYHGTPAITAGADHPSIRFFDVPNVLAVSPTEECGGRWVVCTPETVGEFSAVGYFFARALQDEMNIPIGLIGSNWGGTRVEAWLSEPELRSLNVCGDELDFLARVRAQPELPERLLAERRLLWWSRLRTIDPGSGEAAAWHAESLDDSDWQQSALPGVWDATPAGAFDGVVWYRCTFDVPAGSAGRQATLRLGPIDDMDTTWINGARVGGMETAGTWYIPCEYDVPAGVLRDGANSIAVRVVDTGGAGGFAGGQDSMSLTIHRQGDAATDTADRISLAGAWRTRRGATMEQLGAFPAGAVPHANSPSVLYNGMIAPIRRFAVRGAIWYQGESNRSNAYDYRRLFPAMIANWRQAWGATPQQFPFYFVQIAPFGYWDEKGETPVVRESQQLTMDRAPNTGMVVTMDVGNVADIHPRNKKAVGERLALWALSQTYGRSVGEYSGPIYESMRRTGGRIEVSFTHADGLNWRGDEPVGFQIAGRDRRFVPAQARIEGGRVVVWSPDVAEPAAIRYGWDDDLQPNLFNVAGLPAAPFRTDDWPVVTQP